jgi:hypothetical protein
MSSQLLVKKVTTEPGVDIHRCEPNKADSLTVQTQEAELKLQ